MLLSTPSKILPLSFIAAAISFIVGQSVGIISCGKGPQIVSVSKYLFEEINSGLDSTVVGGKKKKKKKREKEKAKPQDRYLNLPATAAKERALWRRLKQAPSYPGLVGPGVQSIHGSGSS